MSDAAVQPVLAGDAGTRPSWAALGKHLMTRIKAHNVVIMCAGIAFYATLALVPTLVALVSVYSIVTDPAEIAEQIEGLSENLSESTAELIETQLTTIVNDAQGSTGVIGLVVGIVLALFTASGALQKLMLSISMAYATIEGRPGWKVRGLAYLFTAGAIVGIAALVFSMGALPAIMSEIGLSGPTQTLINIARFPVLGVLSVGALTVLYRYGPDRDVKTPWKNAGAVVGTVAFLLFSGLFALYFQFAGSMPDSYGILGSVAAIIIFFQLCAIAVILGAEVNATLEGEQLEPVKRSDRRDAPEPVRTVTPAQVSLGSAIAGLIAIFILGRGD